jgi:hypothetical protein
MIFSIFRMTTISKMDQNKAGALFIKERMRGCGHEDIRKGISRV